MDYARERVKVEAADRLVAHGLMFLQDGRCLYDDDHKSRAFNTFQMAVELGSADGIALVARCFIAGWGCTKGTVGDEGMTIMQGREPVVADWSYLCMLHHFIVCHLYAL